MGPTPSLPRKPSSGSAMAPSRRPPPGVAGFGYCGLPAFDFSPGQGRDPLSGTPGRDRRSAPEAVRAQAL